MILRDLLDEVKSIATGKTIDTLIPPIIYLVAEKTLDLQMAVILSVLSAALLMVYRLVQKAQWQYAFLGFLGVALAAAFALLAGSAVNYYIPELISSLLFTAIAGVTLLLKKPMAVWLSHITRAWPLDWFWRSDVFPAYREVTLFWLILLVARSLLLWMLLEDSNLTGLFLVNTLLGLPATLAVLTLSYVYGIWRLRQLGGPGVEEFQENKPQPWKGQTKGF